MESVCTRCPLNILECSFLGLPPAGIESCRSNCPEPLCSENQHCEEETFCNNDGGFCERCPVHIQECSYYSVPAVIESCRTGCPEPENLCSENQHCEEDIFCNYDGPTATEGFCKMCPETNQECYFLALPPAAKESCSRSCRTLPCNEYLHCEGWIF